MKTKIAMLLVISMIIMTFSSCMQYKDNTALESQTLTETTTVTTSLPVTTTTAQSTTTATTTTKTTTAQTTTIAETTTAKPISLLYTEMQMSDIKNQMSKNFINYINDKRDYNLIPTVELMDIATDMALSAIKLFYSSDDERPQNRIYGILDNKKLPYTDCTVLYGTMMNFSIDTLINCLDWNPATLNEMLSNKWEHVGFYYDNESCNFAMVLVTNNEYYIKQYAETEPTYYEDYYYEPFFDDSSAEGAVQTYLNALYNDDYETYLTITHKRDNSETSKAFDTAKEGYVHLDNTITYWETYDDSILYYGATVYCVYEYNSSGKVKYSFEMDSATGKITVRQDSNRRYYVDMHLRYSMFINW